MVPHVNAIETWCAHAVALLHFHESPVHQKKSVHKSNGVTDSPVDLQLCGKMGTQETIYTQRLEVESHLTTSFRIMQSIWVVLRDPKVTLHWSTTALYEILLDSSIFRVCRCRHSGASSLQDIAVTQRKAVFTKKNTRGKQQGTNT
jgi:hypothetical protein